MITNGPITEGLIVAADDEKIRCDTCYRELKSPVEWIRTGNGFICGSCYQNLLLPNMKISFED